MIKALINLGLVLTPFIVIMGKDTRDPKMIVGIAIAVALGLLALKQGILRKFNNNWVFIFIGYLFVSYLLVPKPEIILFNINVSHFWMWQPILLILVFTLMTITIASLKLNKADIRCILNVMCWAGFLTAIYCVLQYFGIEQFFIRNQENATQGHVGAALGQPVVASTWLAMLVPIMVYRRKWIMGAVTVTALVMMQSQIALGALVLSMAFYFCSFNKVILAVFITLLVVSVPIGYYAYKNIPKVDKFVEDNGRFVQWKTIWNDVMLPYNKEDNRTRASLTGYGIGSFYHVFHVKHNSQYYQAHNEYLEILYGTGFIGLLIFLTMICKTIKHAFVYKNKYYMALLASFLCICVSAGGLFVLQLQPHIYYVVVIIGLLYNQGGKENEEVLGNCSLLSS